jgi:DNA topoisomerase-2
MLQLDTYVGNIKKHTQALWVYENDNMVYRNVIFVLGLYKIFDKILVNVVDNKQQNPSMDYVKVLPWPISPRMWK